MNGAHFTFRTSAYADTEDMRAQNINRIGGHSLASWLSRSLTESGFAASEPWPEDHGWDFSIEHDGANYLCVCALEDGEDGAQDGHVSVDRMRTFFDRLAGRNKFSAEDRVAAAIRNILAGAGEISNLAQE